MGTSYNGGMIVGAAGDDLNVPDELDDWEGLGIISMGLYPGADEDDCYYGFKVPNVLVSDINRGWFIKILSLSEKFKEIMGVEASLIGTQDIF